MAIVVFVAEAIFLVFNRHGAFQPVNVLRVVTLLLGRPFFLAACTWLCYVGLEPYVRRRWPYLLIAWTRLLDGRWRDPLVGRSLMVGCVGGLVAAAILPGLWALSTRVSTVVPEMPWYQIWSLHGGLG